LAARYDLNAKTVAKWRKRTSVEDAPMGVVGQFALMMPSVEEEARATIHEGTRSLINIEPLRLVSCWFVDRSLSSVL
jgi:hypothetical protein